ncbi:MULTISPECIES: hypothetical protein [Bacillus]|uniref:hypothetical protein n=1 Tax=Bacillus TaxID=1386 RepID=UPI00037527F9|nr:MULTISPECIES: hypothetical protein [Bacillus]
MADIKNEIESVREFLHAIFPTVSFKLQNIPEQYAKNTLTIDFVTSKSATETNASYRLDHTIQLVYFSDSSLDCITKMAQIEHKINDEQLIQIRGTSRYLRIGSFSWSKPFKTDTTGVFAVIGMLEVSLREMRTQEVYEKIQAVNTDLK